MVIARLYEAFHDEALVRGHQQLALCSASKTAGASLMTAIGDDSVGSPITRLADGAMLSATMSRANKLHVFTLDCLQDLVDDYCEETYCEQEYNGEEDAQALVVFPVLEHEYCVE